MPKYIPGTKKDPDGNIMVMRGVDYLSDFMGQFGLGIMSNLVGQMVYFYTDKVGLAAAGIGVVMLIAKIIDAFTDIIFGNIFDHAKGGNEKYFKWFFRLMLPAPICVIMMFTVPKTNTAGLIYVLVTNVLLTAVMYSAIASPFGAIMIVRTRSQRERGSMGLTRAIANYGSGMVISIITIPVTNALGGTHIAWIKYGVVVALVVILAFFICWGIGTSCRFASEFEGSGSAKEQSKAALSQSPDEAASLPDAMKMLMRNKYWVIVLLFNLLTQVTSAMAGASGTYYCKWIFGNDNLVAILGTAGVLGTAVGFAISKPIINKMGVRNTVLMGLLSGAVTALVRCILPTNFTLYVVMSLVGGLVQIPLMSLYAVLTGMTVDYNEWKYGKRMVNTASGAVAFGSKVGAGVSTLLVTGLLSLAGYDAATMQTLTVPVRYAIYGFSNYTPFIINAVTFIIFLQFDLEKKLPQYLEDIKNRRR